MTGWLTHPQGKVLGDAIISKRPLQSFKDVCLSSLYILPSSQQYFQYCNISITTQNISAFKCPQPDNPRHGRVIYNSTDYLSVAGYECDYGYKIIGKKKILRHFSKIFCKGDKVRRCEVSGDWSGGRPWCQGEVLLFFQKCIIKCTVSAFSKYILLFSRKQTI